VTDVRKLDLNLVVVLEALLIECNLTRAGERVGMTQPAVSGALARLRELFDDPLLQREGRGFVLTPRAESLIPAVAECMAAVQRTFDALPAFDAETSTRTFLVAASDYVLSELTSPLLGLLEREAPHTRVEFSGMPVAQMISPVDLLRCDVTIAGTGRNVPGKRTSLFSDRFVCLVDAANPALRDGELSIEAIRRLRMVRSVFGPHVSTHTDDMLAEAGIIPSVAMTVQGFLSVPFALPGTPWIGWVPERTANRYAASLGLVIAKTPIAPSVLVEAAHWHPSKSADPSLQWLVKKLREAAEVVEFGDEVD
jgi:DNA-binding transcriptional LysR family regulator